MPRRKLMFLVLILLIVPSAAAFTKVTGFVPGRFDEKRLDIGLVLNQSQMQTFHIEMPQGSELLSIKMCGKVLGSGKAMAVMEQNGTGLEIFNFNEPKDGFAEAITGVFTDVENALTGSAVLEPKGNNTKVLEFTGECIDTCNLYLLNKERIDVFFLVEDGTLLQIDHLEYGFIPPETKRTTWLSSLFSKILNIFR
jgi:hypothetical protein